MTDRLDIEFAALEKATHDTTVVLTAHGPEFGARAREFDKKSAGALKRACEAAAFTGKAKSALEILAPHGLDIGRLILVGCGKIEGLGENDWVNLGGVCAGQIGSRKTSTASVVVDVTGGEHPPAQAAALVAQGALLRHYSFRKYLTKKPKAADDADAAGGEAGNGTETGDGFKKLTVHTPEPEKARAAFARHRAVANGVMLARDLVNEPANVLGPVEFAAHVKRLEKVGVEVEILGMDELKELGMGCLLAVGQGSVRPSRVCVMQWHGAPKAKKSKPIAFIGKGVVFDTGGISIKPAQGMEDMKGDMGGAACVTGLMHALAERKAPVNAVGIIGCVENMPSGMATRPGDIVTSLSGQSVEILNTDAEGRLVLADIMWYAQDRFKPKLMIDLATLTGAIMVALGKEYAGMYVNDDKLSADLTAASAATGEKLWRMPLDKAFHKLIDSKNADVKNIGGRWAGACTAAAFLERFVKDTPWAHLDIAGTAMDAPRNDTNASWGSGWGVRLLDRFVADHHEKADK